jgi:hypothetical protein
MTDKNLKAPRCHAKAKTTGKQCTQPAAIGQKVCYMHGAAAPQNIEAARRRILEAADPVTAELIRIALGGESDAVRVSAAKDVLDRAGMAAKTQVELSGSTGVVIQYLSDEAKEVEKCTLTAERP